ncbi:MAG: hypothetical protein ACYSWW_06385 [Planctomycetota bacterium]|jgi:hypothetical protein
MIDNWGTDESFCDIGPMPWGDGVVDVEDLKVFIKYWEQENMPQETEEGLITQWKLYDTEVRIGDNNIVDFNGRRLSLPKIPSLFICKGTRTIVKSCLAVVDDTIMSLDWPR